MVKTRCYKNGADDDDIVLPSLLLKSSRSMRNLMNSTGTGEYDGDVKEIIDLEKESWRYESAMNAGSIQISPP